MLVPSWDPETIENGALAEAPCIFCDFACLLAGRLLGAVLGGSWGGFWELFERFWAVLGGSEGVCKIIKKSKPKLKAKKKENSAGEAGLAAWRWALGKENIGQK